MKASFLSLPILAAVATTAMAQTVTDTDILNYALTSVVSRLSRQYVLITDVYCRLEHLENAFYTGRSAPTRRISD